MSRTFSGAHHEPLGNEFDRQCSSRLVTALKELKLISSRSTKKWPKEFTILRKHYSETQIRSVLDWYVVHIQEEFTPQAYSAKSFRMKFPRILRAMQRGSATEALPTKITEDARDIHGEYIYLEWRHGEDKILLAIIQKQLQLYSDFRSRIVAISKEWPEKEFGGPMIRYLAMALPAPRDFARNWVEMMHSLSRRWKGWKETTLRDESFHPTSPFVVPLLDEIINDAGYEEGTRHHVWQKIMRMLMTDFSLVSFIVGMAIQSLFTALIFQKEDPSVSLHHFILSLLNLTLALIIWIWTN